MNGYDTRCEDCQRCPECGRTAWCASERTLNIPCEHHGYCGDCNLDNCPACRVAEGLEKALAIGDPFRQDGHDPDPFNVNPAEPYKPYNAAYHQAHRKDPA